MLSLLTDILLDSIFNNSLTYNFNKMNDDIVMWYQQLTKVKEYLASIDPVLQQVFREVDVTGFQLHTVVKKPYTALIAAIIGQKITYKLAKQLRGQLYTRYGTNFTPQQIAKADLSFLGAAPVSIIRNVTQHILDNNIELMTEADIRSLATVSGIGSWTVDTTLLTCLMNWNLFPLGDKFLQARMKRLYSKYSNYAVIRERWAPYKSVVTWYLWCWF